MRISNIAVLFTAFFLLPLTACASDGVMEAAPAAEESHSRLEVDHLIVFTDREESGRFALGDTARESLRIFSYLTGHDGQGTVGAYAYFENFYIEFLVAQEPDVIAANTENVGTDFNIRSDWRDGEGISPFGIGIRDYESDPATLPFETFTYDSEWMGGHFTLAVATNVGNVAEPWTFTMPISVSGRPGPDLRRDGFEEFLAHPIGVQNMTALEIIQTTDAPLSDTMQTLVDQGLITVSRGDAPLATMTFDDGAQGLTVDFRPDLPMVIHY